MNSLQQFQKAGEKGQDVAISYGNNMIVVSHKAIAETEANVQRMGEMILQLGTMIGTMQRRLDDMEERQAQMTISHAEAKRLQALIRGRADELCRKYNLQDKDSPKIFRAAIKKDLLKRFLVKDLHDMPAAALGRAEALVDSWVNIRLAMERRVST